MSVTDAGRDGGSVIQKQKDYPAQPGNIQKIEIKDLDADALYKITVAAINDQGRNFSEILAKFECLPKD
eukprot:m.149286 g.149286  ORF g.149286 m.149286 type:complete len:69 (+) comp38519_c0_seq32:598-804(+)